MLKGRPLKKPRSGVREHVLLNPLIKKLMFETVRDLGRETGDPEADKARRGFCCWEQTRGEFAWGNGREMLSQANDWKS